MPKVTSSRAKTVAAPKKPAPKAKAKTEKKETPKSTGWTAKTGTRRTTAGGRGSDAGRSVGGRGSEGRRTVGGRGSDVSTPDTRRRVADIYAGGRSSGSSSYGSDYSSGGRGS